MLIACRPDLVVTVVIGLWAAQRVHNTKDFVLAGRSCRLHERSDGICDLVRPRICAVSAMFTRDGMGGTSRTCSLVILPAFVALFSRVLRMDL
jgi:hypothetical protein